MAAQLSYSGRFVRKTQLSAGEYHKNFLKLDEGIIAAITSAEADRVTPLMSKIYLRLVNAPAKHWEREGVLRFEAELSENGGHVKAWDVLCETLGVAGATASKALTWLHDSGIIGYFAGKNGVGVRIFLNRASSSIGVRATQPSQKILRFPPASVAAAHASSNEAAFNDSFAVSEVSETEFNPAPKNGAETNREVNGLPIPITSAQPATAHTAEEIVERLLRELVPSVESIATRAAAREHERTREWLESRGLPKAARVAQREAYNVLRQHGLIGTAARATHPGTNVGRGDPTPTSARPLSAEEVRELAQTCVAMLEVHGQSLDVTLSELSAEVGGILLPDDTPRVRELAEAMACGGGRKG